MAIRCLMNCLTGTLLLPASFVHRFLAITVTRCNLLYHCIRRNLLHPLRGLHGVFFFFQASMARTVSSFQSWSG